MKTYSLPFRILITSLILLVIPLLLFAFYELESSYQEKLSDAKISLINLTEQKGKQLGQLTSSKLLLLDKLSYMLDIPKLLPTLPNEKNNQLFRDLVHSGGIWGLQIHKITPDGRFINVDSDQPHFLGEDHTKIYVNIIDIFHQKQATILRNSSRPPHEQLFMTAMLIEGKDHKPLATFTMAVDMTQALKNTFAPAFVPYKISFALLSEFDVVFAASDPDLLHQLFKPMPPEIRTLLTETLLYDDFKLAKTPLKSSPIADSPFFEFDFKGSSQLAYQIKIPHSRAKLVAYVTQGEISSQVSKDFMIVLLLLLLLFGLGAAVVFFLTHLMAKPFHSLAANMNEVKNYNYQAHYQPSKFGFEINYLGGIFNEMLLSMRDYMKRAEEERAQKEAIAQELKIGHTVQRQILPQIMPSYPTVDIADRFISAKEVGGDFYDAFIQEAEGREKLFFTIADASGKGLSACLYALGTHSLVRGFGKEVADLSTIVNRVNKNFYESAGSSGMFVTALLATFDQQTEQLAYISCGHNPALMKRNNGELELLEDHGTALGLMEALNVKENRTPFLSGDTLFLYTDGIIEAHDAKGELFGLERLMQFCREQTPHQSAQEMVQGLIKRIEEFTQSTPQYDDITLLVIKRK